MKYPHLDLHYFISNVFDYYLQIPSYTINKDNRLNLNSVLYVCWGFDQETNSFDTTSIRLS